MFARHDTWWQEQELDAEMNKPKIEPRQPLAIKPRVSMSHKINGDLRIKFGVKLQRICIVFGIKMSHVMTQKK